MIQQIWGKTQGELIAIWISSHNESWKEGAKFFTPPNAEHQVGYFRRPAGYEVKAHKHLTVSRVVVGTPETLVLCKGSLRFDLFDAKNNPVTSEVMKAGDILVLLRGGHGFQFLEDSELLEIKQGPFNPKADKIDLFKEFNKGTGYGSV